jgi:hypothetical protein
MRWVRLGRVQNRTIVFTEPLQVPEGTEVFVQIESVEVAPSDAAGTVQEFATLPFFGMWADRQDIQDSAAWVRQGREQWQHRATRPD